MSIYPSLPSRESELKLGFYVSRVKGDSSNELKVAMFFAK